MDARARNILSFPIEILYLIMDLLLPKDVYQTVSVVSKVQLVLQSISFSIGLLSLKLEIKEVSNDCVEPPCPCFD